MVEVEGQVDERLPGGWETVRRVLQGSKPGLRTGHSVGGDRGWRGEKSWEVGTEQVLSPPHYTASPGACGLESLPGSQGPTGLAPAHSSA